MPHKSRHTVSIPKISIPTFIFGSPTAPLPDSIAFADVDNPTALSFTWDSLREWSKRFASGLLAAGLQQGDRVLIFSPNDVFYPVVFYGIIMAGGIYNSANSRFVARELSHQLQDTASRFMLASDGNLSVALEAADAIGMERQRVFLFNDAPLGLEGGGEDMTKEGVRHWKHLIASPAIGRAFTWEDLTPEQAMNWTAGMNFSSGTTGMPLYFGPQI
jgi:4-coumarate--CoA ligase